MTVTPICFRCKHLDDTPKGSALTCLAFPGGVPGAILVGDADHREPFPGDGGVRFEPIKGGDGGEPEMER